MAFVLGIKNFKAVQYAARLEGGGAPEDSIQYTQGLLSVMFSAVADGYELTKQYINEKFGGDSIGFTASNQQAPEAQKIGEVFQPVGLKVNDELVSVMMPFAPEFNKTFEVIKSACGFAGYDCKRGDDIWNHSAIIQDVFELIFTSKFVICELTKRNPNVLYETGIAHTLGKTVIPIAQNVEDVPFDLRHHRFIIYEPNKEGFAKLSTMLISKLNKPRLA